MDLEDFENIKSDLAEFKLEHRVDTILKNYQLSHEDFVVEFETLKYTL
jgi:hypothetical protein